MGATWGGHIFALNLIALHAMILVLMGRYTTKLYKSYTLFYIVGTSLLIMKIPIIGWSPFKSLEQVGALVVFICFQLIYLCEWTIVLSSVSMMTSWGNVKHSPSNLNANENWKSNSNYQHHHRSSSSSNGNGINGIKTRKEIWEHRFRFVILTCAALIGLLSATTMAYNGTKHEYFTPFPARIMGLFGTSSTGNPLIDSVTEQQPDMYTFFRYLQHLCTAAPIGFMIVLFNFGDGPSFLFVYAITATILTHRMLRVLLLLAPIASILSGITIGRIISWIFCEICHDEYDLFTEENEGDTTSATAGGGGSCSTVASSTSTPTIIHTNVKKHKRGNKKKSTKHAEQEDDGINIGLILRTVMAFSTLGIIMLFSSSFQNYCLKSSRVLSNPIITRLAQSQSNGDIIKVDDYRESYAWLKDHTEEDARILAWWDYGYQITALANRTTLADGNTWNYEHIALIGKILTTNEAEGYAIARHLADYVLIYSGGGSDDLAKSPFIARIANSVYRSVCPGDVTCRNFRFMVGLLR